MRSVSDILGWCFVLTVDGEVDGKLFKKVDVIADR